MKEIKIIEMKNGMERKDAIRLATAVNTVAVQSLKGSIINPVEWCLYETEDNENKLIEVLAIKDVDGDVIITLSPTFQDQFARINSLMNGEDYGLIVVSGVSATGQTFYSCELA